MTAHTDPDSTTYAPPALPLSTAMLISIDIYHKNANRAEFTVKTERTAVSVKAARKPEISAELTAPVSHLRPDL